MRHLPCTFVASGCAALLSFTIAACSGVDPRSQTATEAPAQPSAPKAAAGKPNVPEHHLACAMVTEAEMTGILGRAVVGTANDRSSGKTQCVYQVADGVGPYVEFSVDWGDGEAAMTAMKMMGKIEPGLASAYAGLGDQAAQVGPALMIRTGEDLVTLVFSGVDDLPAMAKKIFDTAKTRM